MLTFKWRFRWRCCRCCLSFLVTTDGEAWRNIVAWDTISYLQNSTRAVAALKIVYTGHWWTALHLTYGLMEENYAPTTWNTYIIFLALLSTLHAPSPRYEEKINTIKLMTIFTSVTVVSYRAILGGFPCSYSKISHPVAEISVCETEFWAVSAPILIRKRMNSFTKR